jgi:hypothetical protein
MSKVARATAKWRFLTRLLGLPQIGVSPSALAGYARRDQTRRSHFVELLNEYGWRNFGVPEYRELSQGFRGWLRRNYLP